MKISGHKNEEDFYKYIRVTPAEAAQKIKEMWQERNEMQVFKGEKENLSQCNDIFHRAINIIVNSTLEIFKIA